jgi:hypothetical protein
MLEHNEHDTTKKESTHLDLRVNGKLHRKTGTTAVFNRQIAIYINMPTLTVINIIKMASNQNAPKRWIGVHTEHNHPKKESTHLDLRVNGKSLCKTGTRSRKSGT